MKGLYDLRSGDRSAIVQTLRYHKNVPAKAKPITLVGHSFGPTRRSAAQPRRIYLLSPANASGLRGKLLLSTAANFSLAQRLRAESAPLGEVFSFISGLYFRGKLAYSTAYAAPPPGIPGVVVITASRGLVQPEKRINLTELQEIAAVPIDAAEPRYRIPLERDAHILCQAMGPHCEAVLLGSVATPKYIEPLLEIFGRRLLFPLEFVGRGDMSRGGLMLRCAREGLRLTYVPVLEAVRHGPRPPKLPKLKRAAAAR
jgi:hypothetical protein